MLQSVQRVERSIKERREVDVPLTNWWLYMLLLSWITFGIYGLVLFFKRINRVNAFIRRKTEYYNGVLTYTQRYAEENGTYDSVHHELKGLTDEVNFAFSSKHKEINALLAFVLTMITFGIYGIVVMYKLNKVWYDLQVTEAEFDDKLSVIWTRLGLTKYPLQFSVDSSKNRSFVLNLVLTFVTFGFWALVWDYKMHTDPDNLYKEFHTVEDTVLATIRR